MTGLALYVLQICKQFADKFKFIFKFLQIQLHCLIDKKVLMALHYYVFVCKTLHNKTLHYNITHLKYQAIGPK